VGVETYAPHVSAEQTLVYSRPSTLTVRHGGANLLLSTSGASARRVGGDERRFFDGFLGHPEQAAAALLAVARVARTRFYTPPGMLTTALAAADPVVTSNGDRLRFESFSACCGVYARLDLLPGSLLDPTQGTGTTNVDFNQPMREALARVSGRDPLRLRIGEDVVVSTPDATVVEKRVALPERWVRGFAEAQVAGARMRQAFTVGSAPARRFVRSLPPRPSNGTLWVAPGNTGLRLSARSAPGAVPVSGADRLRVLDPLLRFARALRAYSADGRADAASVWELELADARFSLAISPDRSRGFSGEGAVLVDLIDETSVQDADLVSALLAFEPVIDVDALAAAADVARGRVQRALTRLGASGRVGFDAAEGSYFHRELPYDTAGIDLMHPRIAGARVLVDAGAVRVPTEAGAARVLSSGTEYVVRLGGEIDRCTCAWFAKYKGSRGPCKHALAVRIRTQELSGSS
jgi:hypothetical protein